MEYVDGMSLAEFLHRVDGHSLTFDEAAAIADALGQALTFAHANGVLHLDIKPANVLIDHSGNVKLTDFGMARLSSAGGFGGSRGGTIGYMPPEQLDIEIDRRRVELGKPIKMTGTYHVPVSLYRDIKGTVTVVVAGESEAEEAIDAIEEAIDIAETPADEMVEVDGEVAADGTVEVEVTETEE